MQPGVLPADPCDDSWEVDRDVHVAETLPPATFTDPGWARREQETLFRRCWLALPEPGPSATGDDRSLEQRVRRRGAYLPLTVAGSPYYLHRGFDGILRLLPNVCTHAWHTLVEGPGRDRKVVCPQHGRVFDDRGRYVRQPGFGPGSGVPRACDHLPAREVHQWGPLLFGSLGAPRQGFTKTIAPVQDSLAQMPWSALERRPGDDEVRTLAGNWKLHAANYLDTLHIPYVHRRPGGLADAVDLDEYQTELHGDAVLQWAYAEDDAAAMPPDWVPARFRGSSGRGVYAFWWFLFPNLTLNAYPWGLSINQYLPDPEDPTRTRFHWQRWSWDEERFADRERLWHLEGVDDEDVDALAKVALGLKSGNAVRGRFAPEGEQAVHWFHHRVWQETRRSRPT